MTKIYDSDEKLYLCNMHKVTNTHLCLIKNVRGKVAVKCKTNRRKLTGLKRLTYLENTFIK